VPKSEKPLSEDEAAATFDRVKENVSRLAAAPKIVAPKVAPKGRGAKRKRAT
jgi:hypothetical protein